MKNIIAYIVILLAILVLGFYLLQAKDEIEIINEQVGADVVDIVDNPVSTVLTIAESTLKDKIVQDRIDSVSVNEWRDTLPKLLWKLKEQAKVSDIEFIRQYRNQKINEVIKSLNARVEAVK